MVLKLPNLVRKEGFISRNGPLTDIYVLGHAAPETHVSSRWRPGWTASFVGDLGDSELSEAIGQHS